MDRSKFECMVEIVGAMAAGVPIDPDQAPQWMVNQILSSYIGDPCAHIGSLSVICHALVDEVKNLRARINQLEGLKYGV